IRPKTPASVGGGFQRAVKSSMDSANIQRGLNPPLNEVSFNQPRRYASRFSRYRSSLRFTLCNALSMDLTCLFKSSAISW
ncbi:MAG: hypothetical protein AB1815_10845, partial [Bacillota bacterium]